MTDFTDKAAVNAFNDGIVAEFRANGGKVGGPFGPAGAGAQRRGGGQGATLLLLTSTGAKSGRSRLNPLAYFGIDGQAIIVGSKAGSDTNPDWVHNLRANPNAHIEIGTESYDVTAHELAAEDRDTLFARIVSAAPGFGEYQAKTSRVIPLFELKRV